jgi:hypothetical protein
MYRFWTAKFQGSGILRSSDQIEIAIRKWNEPQRAECEPARICVQTDTRLLGAYLSNNKSFTAHRGVESSVRRTLFQFGTALAFLA